MLYEALLDLRLDIAIIRAPLASPPDALVVRPFVREKLCSALYQQHPLAGVGALNLASLRTDNWISLDDPQGTGLEQVLWMPVASRALRRRWRSGLTTLPR